MSADLKPMEPRDYVANCIDLVLVNMHRVHALRRFEIATRIADIIGTAAELGFNGAWADARSLAEEAERGAFKEPAS